MTQSSHAIWGNFPLGCAGGSSGALLALALCVPGLGPFAAPALAPLVLASLAVAPGRAALEGGVCGLVLFGAGFAWVLDVRGATQVAPPVLVAGVGCLALFIAAFAASLSALARGRGPEAALWLAPGLWAGLEWLRSLGSFGVPWLWLGSSLAEYPLLVQAADVVGVFGLSAWLVAVCSAGIGAFVLRRRGAGVGLATLGIGVVGYGAVSLALHPVATPRPDRTGGISETFRVAAVQPDIDEELRHDPRRFQPHLRRLLELSEAVLAEEPDLFVWPESAWERPVEQGDPFLGAIANRLGRPLLTGVVRIALHPDRTVRNSVALAEPGGDARTVADKLRPVPVYESAPPEALAALPRGWWPGRTRPGSAPGFVRIPRAGAEPLPVGVLVCFDASFTGVARRLRAQGARLLIGVYNEAQSGRFVAHQQELFARLRAVENRVPVVRVANTGRSTWIDAAGRTRHALAAGAAASGSFALATPAWPPSLYTRLGDAPVVALALLVPAMLGLRPARGPGVGSQGREPAFTFHIGGRAS